MKKRQKMTEPKGPVIFGGHGAKKDRFSAPRSGSVGYGRHHWNAASPRTAWRVAAQQLTILEPDLTAEEMAERLEVDVEELRLWLNTPIDRGY